MRLKPFLIIILAIFVEAPLELWAQSASGVSVSYETTSDWGLGFTGQVTIRNDSEGPLNNWALEMDFGRELQSIWDARIASRVGNRYSIRGLSYNVNLDKGQKVVFGFLGAPGNVATPPDFVRVGSDSSSGAQPGVNVTITETSRAVTGFVADLTIANQRSTALLDWKLLLKLGVSVSSVSNGVFELDGDAVLIRPLAATREIRPNQTVRMRIEGSGRLVANSPRLCTIDDTACTVQIFPLEAPVVDSGPIRLDFDEQGMRSQIAIGVTQQSFKFLSSTVSYSVVSNNNSVVEASTDGNQLQLRARRPGRAAIRIDGPGGTSRWLGIQVRNPDGYAPGMPSYVSLGSVSEDTGDHLSFWRGIATGPKNRRMDLRYIYLNGGPLNGWDTWGNSPGSRAVNYIRNSRTLGMIPAFVFYNIPDGSESYELDLAHVQDPAYMEAYFRNLKLFLDIVRRESPDDMVAVILEPDFLGYLAQNARKPASEIPATTRAAFVAGVLDDSDPRFPDTVQGMVQAINYSISKHAPQVFFGWQMNLWASPAGGFTTPVPVKGLIRISDDIGIEQGRAAIQREAAAITRFYLDAGVASNGARFLSIDKYGLDAVGLQSNAAQDPASSIWFWNNDHWGNYLTFVRAMHETSGLPVVLWQLPVGRINGSRAQNPYAADGSFADLTNTNQRYEDSAPSYFFGDTFQATGARRLYFGSNRADDPGLRVDGELITWPEHISDAARAGVISILFGAGVGASTSGVGDPPTDGYWWITKAQRYFENAVPLSP